MPKPRSFISSSIGLKLLMAITGIFLLGFVIGHLVGNLQVFLGADVFNGYAKFLQSMQGPLWGARIFILLAFLVHIIVAVKLRALNSAARPAKYKSLATVQADPASLYMLQTGIVVLIFVIIHLLHFTLGVLKPEFAHLVDSEGRHDVYSMLVHSFQTLPYAVGYIIAMCCLGFHLSHGISSLFQTLGFNHPVYSVWIKRAGILLAVLIALGYISIPASVLAGIVKLPGVV